MAVADLWWQWLDAALDFSFLRRLIPPWCPASTPAGSAHPLPSPSALWFPSPQTPLEMNWTPQGPKHLLKLQAKPRGVMVRVTLTPTISCGSCPSVPRQASGLWGALGWVTWHFWGGSPQCLATPTCPVNPCATLERVRVFSTQSWVCRGGAAQPAPASAGAAASPPTAAHLARVYKCLKLRAGPKFPPRQQLLSRFYTPAPRDAGATEGPPTLGWDEGSPAACATGGGPTTAQELGPLQPCPPTPRIPHLGSPHRPPSHPGHLGGCSGDFYSSPWLPPSPFAPFFNSPGAAGAAAPTCLPGRRGGAVPAAPGTLPRARVMPEPRSGHPGHRDSPRPLSRRRISLQ